MKLLRAIGSALAFVPLWAGASVIFDGNNDWATATLTTNRSDPLTVMVKFKKLTHPTALDKLLAIGNSPSDTSDAYGVNVAGTADTFTCNSTDSAGLSSTVSVAPAGTDGAWVSVICEFQAADTGRNIRINALTDDGAIDRTVSNLINDIRIGAAFDDGSDYTGRIAEVLILDRAATTGEEDDFIANACTPAITSDEIVYWSLRQGDPDALNNLGSDAGGDLTLVGGAALNADHPAIASCGGTPAFDSFGACAEFDADTVRCDYNANADAERIFACLVAKDAASPPATGAAIEAGTGCISTATESTTGSADTIDLEAGADPLPFHDVIAVVEEGVSNYGTPDTEADIAFTAPAGWQYVNKSGAPGAGEEGLLDDASPAAADGDTMMVQTTVGSFDNPSAAYVVTLPADTVFKVAAGGDTSRVVLLRRFADWSLGAWSDPAPVPLAVNNQPAQLACSGEDFLFVREEPIDFPLDDCYNDPEGDNVTYSITDLPTDGTLTDGETLTGSFDTFGYFTDPEINATDEYNLTVVDPVTFIVGFIVPEISNVLDTTIWDGSVFVSNDEYFRQAVGY